MNIIKKYPYHQSLSLSSIIDKFDVFKHELLHDKRHEYKYISLNRKLKFLYLLKFKKYLSKINIIENLK